MPQRTPNLTLFPTSTPTSIPSFSSHLASHTFTHSHSNPFPYVNDPYFIPSSTISSTPFTHLLRPSNPIPFLATSPTQLYTILTSSLHLLPSSDPAVHFFFPSLPPFLTHTFIPSFSFPHSPITQLRPSPRLLFISFLFPTPLYS